MPASTRFEQQIERLHRLLESEDSEVTWNDRIPDPDNPKQPRQIDVTIRRGGCTTLVECRIHKARQGVKWIEELIGRRASLHADSVIAVSASGFTEGAIRKSEKFGIILRSLYTLSEAEVGGWGRQTKVTVVFYEFSDTLVVFRIPKRSIDIDVVVTTEDGKPVEWRGLFDMAMRSLDDKADLDRHTLDVEIEVFAPLVVSGVKPSSIHFQSRVRRILQEVSLLSVVAYTARKESDARKYAHVAKYDLGAFEILQGDDEVAVVADTSQLTPPPNCLLHTLLMDFGRGTTVKWVKPIGFHTILSHRMPPLKLRITCPCA
jgi:hypothetical protein